MVVGVLAADGRTVLAPSLGLSGSGPALRTCGNPLGSQMALGQRYGVRAIGGPHADNRCGSVCPHSRRARTMGRRHDRAGFSGDAGRYHGRSRRRFGAGCVCGLVAATKISFIGGGPLTGNCRCAGSREGRGLRNVTRGRSSALESRVCCRVARTCCLKARARRFPASGDGLFKRHMLPPCPLRRLLCTLQD